MKGDNFSGVVFYDNNGVVFSKNERQLIAENIKRILTTRKGERLNEPEFGSNVQRYLFMPQMAINDLIAEIITSRQNNEPRVTVSSCTLTSANQDGIIHIKLDLILNKIDSETMSIGVNI